MKLYDRFFSINQKISIFLSKFISEKFSVVFAAEHKRQRPWLLKAPKVGRSLQLQCIEYDLSTAVFHNSYKKSSKLLVFGKIF